MIPEPIFRREGVHPRCLQKSAEVLEARPVATFVKAREPPKSAQAAENEAVVCAGPLKRENIAPGVVHPRAICKVIKGKALQEKQFVSL